MKDNVHDIESGRNRSEPETVTITMTLHDEHREAISLWRKKRREHGESHSEQDALLHFLCNGMDHWLRDERFVENLQSIKNRHEELNQGLSMNSAAYTCPVPICNARKGTSHVVCRSCWARVSQITRNKVWSLYRNPKTRGSVTHVEAIRKAINEAHAALMEVS